MNLFTRDWSSCFTGNAATDAVPLSCIWVVLQNVINAALVLSGLVAVFLIIYAGFQYVTSNGDKEKVDAARKRITYAIIGLVFIVMSYTIILFISQVTGVDKTQLLSPPGDVAGPTGP